MNEQLCGADVARQPDDTLDRLLTRHLRSRAATGEVCPSAEDIAAYLERSLVADEAQRIELHLSSCSRCAETLAALVDTEPVVPSPAPADASWSWRTWRTWRWAAPATAVLVLGIWLASAIRDERTTPAQMAQHTETGPVETVAGKNKATPPESAAEAVATPPSPLPGFEGAGPAVTTAPADAAAATDLRRSSELPASVSADARAQAAGAPQVQQELALQTREVQEQAGVPETGAKSEARAEAPTVDEQRRRQSQGQLPGAPADGRPSLDAISAPASSAALEVGQTQGGAIAAFSAAAPLILRARAGNMVWRISGSEIERSVDGGVTWATEFRAANTVRAGVVTADNTVWLVGAGGLVLQRLPTAAWRVVPASVMDDLVSVTEGTATSVTVRTANGRQLRTTDNGASWTVR